MKTNKILKIKKDMNNSSNHKLIEGSFPAYEAAKILFALVNSKINYHNLDSLISKERVGSINELQKKRIRELNEVNSEVKKIVDYAAKENLTIKLNCDIKIDLVKE
ncbi:MAG: hypothetical protein SFY56_09855 [Bacteroidota bacterium]|nr:hypothetical protein [Bacteroidota bacterium]